MQVETAADVDHFAGREGKPPFGERRDGLADVVRMPGRTSKTWMPDTASRAA